MTELNLQDITDYAWDESFSERVNAFTRSDFDSDEQYVLM